MSSLPPLNEKLIACVLDHIENHREEWDQSDWLVTRGCKEDEWCGTTGCFAGWAVALSTPEDQWPIMNINIQTEATRLLGLTDTEAGNLFRGSNSLSDLKWYLGEFRKARMAQEGDNK